MMRRGASIEGDGQVNDLDGFKEQQVERRNRFVNLRTEVLAGFLVRLLEVAKIGRARRGGFFDVGSMWAFGANSLARKR